MYDSSNIFAKIIAGEIPCEKVYEDDDVLAFYDIHPAAPVHVMIVPQEQGHVSFDDFVTNSEPGTVCNFFRKIAEIAEILGLNESGYRLITNYGKDAIQTVGHFHVHMLGGERLGPLLANDRYHL